MQFRALSSYMPALYREGNVSVIQKQVMLTSHMDIIVFEICSLDVFYLNFKSSLEIQLVPLSSTIFGRQGDVVRHSKVSWNNIGSNRPYSSVWIVQVYSG